MNVCNRYASGGKNACSSHYINQKELTQIVLTGIRCKAMWAQNSRETLRTQLLAREQNASAERTRTLQAELNAIGKRLPELDKLIQSAYEDITAARGHPTRASSWSRERWPGGSGRSRPMIPTSGGGGSTGSETRPSG